MSTLTVLVKRESEGRLSRLSGPPLIVQLIALLIGALIAAQLVTLLLTLVIPPAPPRQYVMSDIAAALRSDEDDSDRFDRIIQSGPPDLSARGWFVSEASRAKLARLLDRPVARVALGFFTQLPVGGTVEPVAPPRQLPGDAERIRHERVGTTEPSERKSAEGFTPPLDVAEILPAVGDGQPRFISATLFQQVPGGPPGSGFPGGGPPGGGFPGTGLPGGGFPQSLPRPANPQQQQSQPRTSTTQPAPPVRQTQQQAPPTSVPQDQVPAASPPEPTPPTPATPPPVAPGAAAGSAVPQLNNPVLRPLVVPTLLAERRPDRIEPAAAPAARQQPAQTAPATSDDGDAAPPVPPAASTAGISPTAETTAGSTVEAPASSAASPPLGRPLPIVRPQTSLFGLASAPFVEGDFIAGVRLADGRWVVVSPRAEGFPNAWQRRVALWFVLSLLAVAPIAWLFARRIVGPLNDFAYAADLLGRDPSAAVLPLDGPAEIGRAAHAFNQMQSRLRSFVDDRTAMIGAISHDLRTPLTRLRFRIEDVPEDQQEDLRGEVDDMEEMISSVIAFMRDASIPNARERRDLAEIVDDVIEDATLLGDVEAGRVESAIVDIDALGIRRILDNLLTNAIKYGGGHARVVLHVEDDCAIADIVDDGPGVAEAELERIFEPFYRSESARRSNREGSGLGLAVCRSIARAHGGDVKLFQSDDGFTARIILPLAFHDGRKAA